MALPNKPSIKNVWATSGVKVEPSDTKVNTGWIVERPPHQFQNFLQNRSDQFLKHINEAGIPLWDAVTVYTAGKSYAQGSDGKIYKCLVDGFNENPVGNPTKWVMTFGDLDVLEYANQASDSAIAAANSASGAATSATTAVNTLAVFDDTPPASPFGGRHWTDSNTGKTYEWIIDADSGQWVEVGNPTAVAATAFAEYLGTVNGASLIGTPEGTVQEVLDNIGLTGAVKTVDLAASTGATLVGTPTGTVQAALDARVKTNDLAAASTVAIGGYTIAETQDTLDNAKTMQNYTALRAYTGRATGVRITTSGVAGMFWRDASDTTSADNGGTIIVDGSGRRWKRFIVGYWNVKWFGVKGDGVTDDTIAINLALVAAAGFVLVFDPATYIVDGTLLRVYSNTTVRGYGATLKLKAGTYSTTRYFFGTNTGITYDAGYAETAYVDIAGITLDGNIANVTTTDSCYGINAYRTRSFFVSDVKIKDLPGTIGGGYGIAFSYSTDVMANKVNINRTDRQNIVVWETKNARIDGCTLKDSYFRDCILVSSFTPATFQASECIITNSECRNTMSTGTHVIRFSGESGGKMSNLRLYGYQSGATGLHGIYITDIYPKHISIENVSINDCYRGVEVSSDAAHILEFTGLQIGLETPCYDGFRANTNGAIVKISGGSISATNQVLYLNAVDYQSVIGVELTGGTQNSAIFSESAGITVFNNNTVRGNTNASYPVLFGGAGEPIILGNKTIGNTVNTLRVTTGAIASGNSSVTIDGVARSGSVTKRSTTANRPVLAATDIMFPFMDTTLAAAGKPIWWTGTTWVDSTGAVV